MDEDINRRNYDSFEAVGQKTARNVKLLNTAGEIVLMGIGSYTNNSALTINDNDLLNVDAVAGGGGMTTEEHDQLMRLKNAKLLIDGEIIA